AETELANRLGAQRMDEDIGSADKPHETLLGCRLLQIENDAALVAVEMEKAAGHSIVAIRTIAAERVTLRALDLDDVGAHVCENMRRERTHDHVRQVDDANAAQGTVARIHDHSNGSFSRDWLTSE